MKLKTKKQIIDALKDYIEQSEYLKNAYFWKSPSHASSRRAYEKTNSRSIEFDYKNEAIKAEIEITCSCNNIYASKSIYKSGVKKDIRLLKGVLKELQIV